MHKQITTKCQIFLYAPIDEGPIPYSDPSKSWYTKQQVGINTIKGMIPKIFEKAGLQEKYSNHPLPATRMFNAGIQYKESNC